MSSSVCPWQALFYPLLLSVSQSSECTARNQGTVQTPDQIMSVFLFKWSILLLHIRCFKTGLHHSVLYITHSVSRSLFTTAFFFFFLLCLLAAVHRLLIFYMRHASDRDRLDLKLFIMSASQDVKILQLNNGEEQGTAGAWHLMSKGACRPEVTVPSEGCDWHLCLLLTASLLSPVFLEWAEFFIYLAHLRSIEQLDC